MCIAASIDGRIKRMWISDRKKSSGCMQDEIAIVKLSARTAR